MSTTTPEAGHTPASVDLTLAVSGMTCSSCANRIERKLNKLEGVTATVNYATESATVSYDPELVQPDSARQPPSRRPATARPCRRRPERAGAPAAARCSVTARPPRRPSSTTRRPR